jgi:transposase
MGARFIGCDRDQVFLMPPSVRDWVPEGHLVWTVLDAVAELDMSAFYVAYRADGRARPAYEPSMMVALLLYAYARGNRSSRGIERACVEDVAYRVVAGNLAPDHSTIAEFRCRHERPLADVFSGVLGLCARAGLVSVGVVAIDGTKIAANASLDGNRDFGRLAREILAEAAETDRREDELYGSERGDELPEHLRTREGRRKALREAKERLERERGRPPEAASEDDDGPVSVELDPQRFVTRPQGAARGCARAAVPWNRSGSVRADRSPRTAAIGCLRRAGAWRKSSMSSTLPMPPMTRGGRAAWRPTGRGGWRRAWSSRTSRC